MPETGQNDSSYLISGILFLLTALIFLGFNVYGHKTGNFVAGVFFALTAIISFYKYSQKKSKKNKDK